MKMWYLFTESSRCRLIPSSISQRVCDFCVNLAIQTTDPSVCDVYCPRFTHFLCVWTFNCKLNTTFRANVEFATLFNETYRNILSSSCTWLDAAAATCVYRKRCPLEFLFLSKRKNRCSIVGNVFHQFK